MFAGITMLVDDRVTTQAFTDPTCPHIDQAHYDSGHGPCLDAFRNGSAIVVESLEAEGGRYAEFAAAAMAHGVYSTLSLPVLTGERSIGAMNSYAGADRAFGETDADVGQVFADQAAVVLVNAEAYWDAQLKIEHLQRALAGREVIDLAKGIIMKTTGCDANQAFETLVKQSQAENRKLRDVAADIVARAQRS